MFPLGDLFRTGEPYYYDFEYDIFYVCTARGIPEGQQMIRITDAPLIQRLRMRLQNIVEAM